MNVFYLLSSKLISSTLQVHPEGLDVNKDDNYSEHDLIAGEYSKITFPIVFRQAYGKNATDILDTGWASLYLISDRLKHILSDAELIGWKTFEVKVYDSKGNEIPGYHGFSVTGRCGPIMYKKSDIRERRRVPEGALCRYYKGMYFDVGQWDGSDFFLPQDRYYAIITQRAADVLRANKVTNMKLKPLSEAETNVRYVEPACVMP